MIQSDAGAHELQSVAVIDCSGVFDAKWRPGDAGGIRNSAHAEEQPLQGEKQQESASEESEAALVATALADGSCTLMRAGRGGIEAVAVASDAAGGGMALSCDWDTSQEAVYCSSSNGRVSCCRVAEAGVQVVSSWAAHDMEVWMVSCDLHRVSLPGFYLLALCKFRSVLARLWWGVHVLAQTDAGMCSSCVAREENTFLESLQSGLTWNVLWGFGNASGMHRMCLDVHCLKMAASLMLCGGRQIQCR